MHYPPNLLLIALIAVVFVALLRVSVILSRQRQQIERLIEDTAILSAEIAGCVAPRRIRARSGRDAGFSSRRRLRSAGAGP